MRATAIILTLAICTLAALPACTPKPAPDQTREALVAQESSALNAWFEDRYDDQLARSPLMQSYYGINGAQDRLDDVSQLAADEDAALQKAWLKDLKSNFDADRLDAQSALSYRLYEYSAEDALSAHGMSGHEYVFNHMSGPHSNLPSFLINFHKIETVDDAKAFIERLKQFETYLGNYAQRAEAQFENGVSLPQFVYPKLIESARNVITGVPFTMGTNESSSPLWADFTKKIDGLNAKEQRRLDSERVKGGPIEDTVAEELLMISAKDAMLKYVGPAYENLIAMFERHAAAASSDDGVWKLPNGKDYYASRLKHYTTTDMTADEIHEIGLKDVARIQDEMRLIMKQVGFEGSLREFFTHLRTDPKFTFANDDAGRAAYITQATQMIDDMRLELDDLFVTKPKADMVVKRVEPFREASAFGAFYNGPALDGSRPGTYYINLKDMSELPIYQMQALAYHEGIPGHHMQIALAQELKGLPKFRTTGGYTAYTEGWALYSESIPKELGLYTDPYQDFGRLSMEIFRSARLVLDTGIHAKKWTREQAVTYMMNNTANSEGDIRAEIDRYIVWPGQATAYKIGMIKIEELRKTAEDKLGDKFDIREFHDVILTSGPVPLSILEELVEGWVKTKT